MPVESPSILDQLTQAASAHINNRGLQVYIKTNFGPAIKVYDADTPSESGEGLLKTGMYVTNRAGKELASYGGKPATDYILLGSVSLMAAGVAFLMLRGIVK